MEEGGKEYLRDRTKDLLEEQLSGMEREDKPEMKIKRNKMDEKVERKSTSKIPFHWDPREIEYFNKNRKKMSNEEVKEFLKKESEVQEKLETIDDWKEFSRWEERFLVQKNSVKDLEELSEDLGREKEEVELKLHMLGLKNQ